jgi:hypothetical protein
MNCGRFLLQEALREAAAAEALAAIETAGEGAHNIQVPPTQVGNCEQQRLFFNCRPLHCCSAVSHHVMLADLMHAAPHAQAQLLLDQ